MQETTDGGYIIADSALIKLDSNGDMLWSKPYRDGAGGYSLQQTTDGGYIVTGTTPSAVYLHKTDSNGDTLWTNSYSGGAWGCTVEQTSDGDISFQVLQNSLLVFLMFIYSKQIPMAIPYGLKIMVQALVLLVILSNKL